MYDSQLAYIKNCFACSLHGFMLNIMLSNQAHKVTLARFGKICCYVISHYNCMKSLFLSKKILQIYKLFAGVTKFFAHMNLAFY